MAVDGPIVCFEAAESNLQGDHSPVIIKQITVEKPRLSRRSTPSRKDMSVASPVSAASPLSASFGPIGEKLAAVSAPLLARFSSASASADRRSSSSEPPEPLSRRASLSLRQQTSGAFPPNTLFRLKEIKPAGSWLAPDGETRPGVDLLVVTATFKALSMEAAPTRRSESPPHLEIARG